MLPGRAGGCPGPGAAAALHCGKPLGPVPAPPRPGGLGLPPQQVFRATAPCPSPPSGLGAAPARPPVLARPLLPSPGLASLSCPSYSRARGPRARSWPGRAGSGAKRCRGRWGAVSRSPKMAVALPCSPRPAREERLLPVPQEEEGEGRKRACVRACARDDITRRRSPRARGREDGKGAAG